MFRVFGFRFLGFRVWSEGGGMIRLETLIELKFLNSSFSSSSFSIRTFRACPLVEIIETVPCRVIRGESSDSRQQHLSQRYPPPLVFTGAPPRTRDPSAERARVAGFRTGSGQILYIYIYIYIYQTGSSQEGRRSPHTLEINYFVV